MMMTKVAGGEGKHVNMSKYFHQEIKQIRLEPSKFKPRFMPKTSLGSDTCFNIDGEKFDSDSIIVTCLPGIVNLFGTVYDKE